MNKVIDCPKCEGRRHTYFYGDLDWCDKCGGAGVICIDDNAHLETDDKSNLTEGHNYSESPARPKRATDAGRKQTERDN